MAHRTESSSSPYPHAVTISLYAAAGLLISGMLWVIIEQPLLINWDVALFLQHGILLVDGKMPYVDYLDVNLPLIGYLNAIPTLLARLTDIHPVTMLSLLLVGVVIWSSEMIRRLARRNPEVEAGLADMMMLAWVGFSFVVFRQGHFGQREHVFALLYMPYFIARCLRVAKIDIPTPAALLLGAAAGVGMAIKPQFVLVAAAPEAYWLIARRKPETLLKPEVLAALGVGVAYGLHFFLAPAPMREAFFNYMLPLTMQGYQAYRTTDLSAIVAHPKVLLGIGLALAGMPFPATRGSPLRTMLAPLVCVIAAGLLIYVAQMKGWSYQILPAAAGVSLLITVMADGVIRASQSVLHRLMARWRLDRCLGSGWLAGSLFASSVLLFVVVATEMPRQTPAVPPSDVLDIITAHSQKGDGVLFINTSTVPAYPLLVQLERQPATRYTGASPIGLLYSDVDSSPLYRDPEDMPPFERRYLEDLASDIRANRPVLIFIYNRPACQSCPPGFIISEYLEQAGFLRLVEQEHYTLLALTPDNFWLVYRLATSES